MTNKTFLLVAVVSAFAASISLAQLNGENITPDLSSVDIPAFNGATFSETISATSVSFEFSQGLTSNRLTGAGTISATDVFDNGSISVDSIGGNINFSASLALRGRIVSLAGAKATLAGVTGSGSAVVSGESYGVDVTAVTGAFTIRNMIINLDSEEISGVIVRGSLRISGRATDYPNIRRTVVARYTQENLGPSPFSGEIVNPSLALILATSPKGKITGSATGTFGNYDDVAFNVTRGQRNARSGISTVTLVSTGVRGVSATLNLDGEGELVSRPKSSLQVLGYRLQFP
jgi:hypothetical protein